MARMKRKFEDSDVVGVEDVTGVIVITLDSDSLINLQDDEGLVVLHFLRADIDAIYEHARINGCLSKEAKSGCKPIHVSDHDFNDPNILSVRAYNSHVELLLNAILIERLSVKGNYQLRMTGLDVAVIKHHFAYEVARSIAAQESGKLWHALFGYTH